MIYYNTEWRIAKKQDNFTKDSGYHLKMRHDLMNEENMADTKLFWMSLKLWVKKTHLSL